MEEEQEEEKTEGKGDRRMGQDLGKAYRITWWGSCGEGLFLFYIKRYDESVSIAIMKSLENIKD